MKKLYPDGMEILGDVSPAYAEILTPDALALVAKLVRQFAATRESLLARRVQRQADIDAGKMPDFLPETETIRNADWKVAPLPVSLRLGVPSRLTRWSQASVPAYDHLLASR